MTGIGQIHSCDVLIVGGGLAACMAALEASKRGADVILVDKGRLGRSGSSPTSGGVPQAAFGHADPNDSKDAHFRDTVIGGDYIPHQKIVRTVVSEITDRIIELEEIGLHFKKTADGKKFYQEKRLGSSFARSVPPIGGSVGMMGTLRKEVFNREVNVHQWTMITKLFRDRDRVAGALGVNIQTGETRLYKAKSTILAAGSAVALQKYTSANFQTTGDAYVAAFDIGAQLANLEFLDFMLIPAPNGITVPMAGLSPFTSKGGRFLNAAGERFLEKVRSRKTRWAQLGQSSSRPPTKKCLRAVAPSPLIRHSFLTRNGMMKFNTNMRPNSPPQASIAAEIGLSGCPPCRLLGGIFINELCESGVSGLFASGESSTGMHGSNRLSGNAIASCMVLGARSGKSATLFAGAHDFANISESEVSD